MRPSRSKAAPSAARPTTTGCCPIRNAMCPRTTHACSSARVTSTCRTGAPTGCTSTMTWSRSPSAARPATGSPLAMCCAWATTTSSRRSRGRAPPRIRALPLYRPAFMRCARSAGVPIGTSAPSSMSRSCWCRSSTWIRCCRSAPTASRSTPTGFSCSRSRSARRRSRTRSRYPATAQRRRPRWPVSPRR